MKRILFSILVVLLFGSVSMAGPVISKQGSAAGGTGAMATDVLWDAKGDLAVGTGSNTGAKLTIGTNYQVLHVATDTPGWTSTLGATGTRLTKGWFTDLEITNAPTINGGSFLTGIGGAAVGQTFYIGTTQVAINRASASLTLAGLTLTAPDIGAATGTSLLATGRIDGTVGMVLSTANSATTISSTDNKSSYYMNQGDSAAHSVYTLPTAAAGLQYCVRNYTGITQVIKFQTSASGQYIDLDGTNTGSGKAVKSGGAAGDAGCVVGVDATHWMFYTNKGTWAIDNT
jgi:hypothetical protein